ncbi:THAP domain-containing protein 1-like [Harpegnathos saltator]|uniref:THAP domain-containing protein 1-like n=1 Tax=Harpegnathos saltator TaxID=610380 RepID=UPI00058ECA38|nr:THAP domain-containing protein 1-like [Harpegnathos saltator]
MVSCCLCGFSKTKGRTETFHSFPTRPWQRQKWIEFMNIPNWQPLKNNKLCSKHFTPDCFDTSGKITRLNNTAVPTIKFGRIKHQYFILSTENSTINNTEEVIPSEISVTSKISVPQIMKVNTINVKDKESIFTQISALQADRSSTLSREKRKKNSALSYYPAQNDTPRKSILKRKILEMATNEQLLLKHIRKLQKVMYRQKQQIQNLTSVIQKLYNNSMITYNAKEVL